MKEYLETRVTNLGVRYGIQLIDTRTRKVIDEMGCSDKRDTGFCIRYMLRWHDKLGGLSPMAIASRGRQRSEDLNCDTPVGKIWYSSDIAMEKAK